MGPALQKLLARPGARELLRCLTRCPGAVESYAPAGHARVLSGRGGRQDCQRRISGVAVAPAIANEDSWSHGSEEIASKTTRAHHLDASSIESKPTSTLPSIPLHTRLTKLPAILEDVPIDLGRKSRRRRKVSTRVSGKWEETMWTHEQLDFESDLDHEVSSAGPQRLLDLVEHRQDLGLWALFLGYRKRIYGNAGVVTIWLAMRTRDIRLPMEGKLADTFWGIFVAAGCEIPNMLADIHAYAVQMQESHGQRWVKLYAGIIQHFLLAGDAKAALRWHTKLIKLHPPSALSYREMCRVVVREGGDVRSLKRLYGLVEPRNSYARIISLLCSREDFKAAYTWHSFLTKHGDYPAEPKVAEPLIHFYAIYEPEIARRITKTLVDGGVSYAATMSKELNDNVKISRTMMNLVHGQTFNVPVKSYNDNLGSRWFATSWVSLDVAISTVHALGVQEIGPLSLQAIALREPDAENIVARLNQLRDLNISTGTSVFAQALEHFARNRKQELLEALLHNDQHPDELEDRDLQESLLVSFAQAKNWPQYRLTVELQAIRSSSPEITKQNMELRILASTGNTTDVTETIEDMDLKEIPVRPKSIARILGSILAPRNEGRRPMRRTSSRSYSPENLQVAIKFLQKLMRAGNYVAVTHWREIIKRLGMLGQFQDLARLCTYLASWYGPTNPRLNEEKYRQYRIAKQVPTSHPFHPLKILFSAEQQKAIVEWGFISSLGGQPSPGFRTTRTSDIQLRSPADMTTGITLLKELTNLGVHIDSSAVRSALIARLVTYYGPGRSNKVYNRTARGNIGTLEEVAKQIDESLAGEYFTAVPLAEILLGSAEVKMKRMGRMRRRGGQQSRDPQTRYLDGMYDRGQGVLGEGSDEDGVGTRR